MGQLPRVMADEILPDNVNRQLRDVVELVPWRAQPPADYANVLGLWIYGHPVVDPSLMERLPHLKVVSNHGVGVDHIDVTAARKRGIVVGNTPDVLNGAVADLAFGLILATARRIPESMDLARDPSTQFFDPSQLHGQDVHGAVLGIVGLGRIGFEIALRAQGFRMRVLYHNRHRRDDAEESLGVEYRHLPDLLSASDMVVLTVPLTQQTVGLIGAAELRHMKSSAILINVSRGSVVNTDGLVAALQSGRLWGAGLDVTDPEPLPRGHPLLSMPNVVITSHVGSATRQTRHQMEDLSVQNLLLGLEGRPLKAPV